MPGLHSRSPRFDQCSMENAAMLNPIPVAFLRSRPKGFAGMISCVGG
jgi:hypothetical protein